MKDRNFVITSLQVWDIEIGSTIKNTALEISKSNKVLYVNAPMDHSTWLHGGDKPSYTHRMDVIKRRKPVLRKVNENLWVLDCPFMVYSINKISSPAIFNFFNRINNKKIGRLINKTVAELGFDNIIHLIDNDIYRSFYLKEYINPTLSIYYRRDFVIGESYWKRHGKRLEPLLCSKSDIVLANSLYFANELKEYNRFTYNIETGVDLELYDYNKVHDIPADIASIPHPIVGYIGTLTELRLDDELMYSVAEHRPEYSFVFTGPEDEFFKFHKIHSLSNVYFLGNKQRHELPAYVSVYDVCINPQKVNDITIGNYPLKIDEYLAMGKPVVATKTHTMEHIFSRHVWLASSLPEYLDLIDKALAEAGDEKKRESRINFARTHSWQNSIQKIYGIIDFFIGAESR